MAWKTAVATAAAMPVIPIFDLDRGNVRIGCDMIIGRICRFWEPRSLVFLPSSHTLVVYRFSVEGKSLWKT